MPTGQPYGCLTMYNTSTNYGDHDRAVSRRRDRHRRGDGLHKIYSAQGGQVYIYSTADGSSINNQYVTVTGTAYDVAYMDAHHRRRQHRLLICMTANSPIASRPMCWPSPRIATMWSRPAAERCCAWRRAGCAPPFST